MRKRIQRYEGKELLCIRVDLMNVAEKVSKSNAAANKKKLTKMQEETASDSNASNGNNVFTDKYFNPNQNFSNYLRDHRTK